MERIKIVNKGNNKLPEYAKEGDSGLDLRANIDSPITIGHFKTAIIPTGIFVEIPKGLEFQVRGRSGLWFKHDIVCPTGTIDSGYRDEIMVKLFNLGENPYTIRNGDRIAQIVCAEVVKVFWHQLDSVEQLELSKRGNGGFGHTGID